MQMGKIRHNFDIFLLSTLKALDKCPFIDGALLIKIVLGTSKPPPPPAKPPHPVLLPPSLETEKAIIIIIIIIIIVIVVVFIIIIITPIQPDNLPRQHSPEPPAP